MLGYNLQTAVDTRHHLIVAREVTNVGNDRAQLAAMAKQTKAALGTDRLDVVTSTAKRSWPAMTTASR